MPALEVRSMPGSLKLLTVVRFVGFELDVRAGELRRPDGTKTRLGEQPLRILLVLLENPGRVVLREEIRKKLWPNDTVVEFEHSIGAAMSRLRQALGDSADKPRYIETLARRGYRWMTEVERVEESPAVEIRGPAGRKEVEAASGDLIEKTVSHYKVLELLGTGGMGVVYKAEDVKLGRRVALKFLPDGMAGDPRALERFEREALAISGLDHPNICTIYEVEEHAGRPFLVMQLLEGQTLRKRIESHAGNRACFRNAELLDTSLQIASGLEAAHKKGMIHRDIKPANIFLTDRGEAKILDFGLAKLVESGERPENAFSQDLRDEVPMSEPAMQSTFTLSRTGLSLGTPAYLSPEQVSGEKLDARTDVYSFGLVLYEMATGIRAIAGNTAPELREGVLDNPPRPVRKLNPEISRGLERIIRRAITKDREARYRDASAMREDLLRLKRGRKRWRVVPVAAAGLAMLAIGVALWLRAPTRMPDHSQWVPLTKFPDPVSQPALSPDGRMLAFVRSRSTFFALGQIYVKVLPDGEPVQLTHDSLKKMSPVFSPDGARIAYTVVDPQFNWDTWVVPVRGGEPQRWLRNAADLVWTGPRRVLFSEVKSSPHMGIVTAEEDRIGERDVYLPLNDRGMAHRAHVSPDGKWVLLAELGGYGNWEPCRVVPIDAGSAGRQVGPSRGGCTFGAWSPDGKWVYLTSKAGGLYHIWRQPFPDGPTQQLTSGLTEEEGIAMASDGRSFVTAVALQSISVWVHDTRGERQISLLEGNAAYAKFTPDGKKLCYRIVKEVPRFGTAKDPGEVWVADLNSGHSEPLVPGFQPLDYDISADGKQVVMEADDSEGKPRLWLTSLERPSPPRPIPNVEGRTAMFGPSGEIFFRHMEGSSAFVYRVRPDGTGLRKALEQPVLGLSGISPDGRWIEVWSPLSGNRPAAVQVFPLGGGSPVLIGGNTWLQWSPGGDSLWISGGAVADGRTYIIPLRRGESLPRIPAGGFLSEQDVAHLPGARSIDAAGAPGPRPDVYAFYRGTTQRNLYRIPVP
jgi:serine/threonine protein kinase/Tol biopolymer transport system component